MLAVTQPFWAMYSSDTIELLLISSSCEIIVINENLSEVSGAIVTTVVIIGKIQHGFTEKLGS